MKPVQQVFALVLEQLPEFTGNKGKGLRQWNSDIRALKRKYPNQEEYNKKEEALRNKQVKKILFDKYLVKTNNMKNRNQDISNFFDKLL